MMIIMLLLVFGGENENQQQQQRLNEQGRTNPFSGRDIFVLYSTMYSVLGLAWPGSCSQGDQNRRAIIIK